MPVTFKAKLPRYMQTGDQVVFRGTLQPNPSRISFNFIVEENPQYVALHFKTSFGCDNDRAVVLNSKNGHWGDELHDENTWQIGGDSQFHFVFVFLDDAIRIYTSQNGTNSFQYQYQHKLPFERITSFEVWDDLETVQEIAFRYSNSNN